MSAPQPIRTPPLRTDVDAALEAGGTARMPRGSARERALSPRRSGPVVSLLLVLGVLGEAAAGVFRPRTSRRVETPARSATRLAQREVTLIEPRRSGALARVREFWRYRRLLHFFARRYIQKRYARTWLGWLWLPLRPILDVGSRVLLFGALLSVPSEGKPYLLFYLVGVSAWNLFGETAYWATRSLEINRGILRRLYVPRLAVLVAAAAPSLVNYLLYLGITVVVVAYYLVVGGDFYLAIGVDSLTVLGGLALMLALGLCIGLWTAVYGAQARDVRFSLRYLLNLWLFVTPVIYPLSAVPAGFRDVAMLNPMTAPVEMVRHGLLGTGGVPGVSLAVTFGTIGVLALSGLWFFGRSEAAAVDSL